MSLFVNSNHYIISDKNINKKLREMEKLHIVLLLGGPEKYMKNRLDASILQHNQIMFTNELQKKQDKVIFVAVGLPHEVRFFEEKLDPKYNLFGRGNKSWDTYSNFSVDFEPILQKINEAYLCEKKCI